MSAAERDANPDSGYGEAPNMRWNEVAECLEDGFRERDVAKHVRLGWDCHETSR